jgi:MipA family protein
LALFITMAVTIFTELSMLFHSFLNSSLSSSSAPQVALLSAALALSAACNTVGAQTAPTKPAEAKSPWNVSLGAAVVSSPEYEGAKRTVSGLAPDVNISYKTDGWGTFGVGSKSRGISWTAIDKDEYSLGISLGANTGRKDNADGTLFSPGSKRLKGMGEIKSSADISVFGHYTVGVPIMLQFTKNTGDGKVDAKNGSFKGHGGTEVSLSTDIPIPLTSAITLSISPSLNWADSKYMQTYFGVSAAQSANSGFKQYKADGGIKSLALSLGANYQIDKHWAANVGVTFSQLQGNAAKSPLVERKGQTSVVAGVNYTF